MKITHNSIMRLKQEEFHNYDIVEMHELDHEDTSTYSVIITRGLVGEVLLINQFAIAAKEEYEQFVVMDYTGVSAGWPTILGPTPDNDGWIMSGSLTETGWATMIHGIEHCVRKWKDRQEKLYESQRIEKLKRDREKRYLEIPEESRKVAEEFGETTSYLIVQEVASHVGWDENDLIHRSYLSPLSKDAALAAPAWLDYMEGYYDDFVSDTPNPCTRYPVYLIDDVDIVKSVVETGETDFCSSLYDLDSDFTLLKLIAYKPAGEPIIYTFDQYRTDSRVLASKLVGKSVDFVKVNDRLPRFASEDENERLLAINLARFESRRDNRVVLDYVWSKGIKMDAGRQPKSA